jgi:RNA polymerase sigma-70 factor (ECF subfamily)
VPLLLYAVEGYKYEEIAGLLGLALGTIKAQIHRARRLLTEELKP